MSRRDLKALTDTALTMTTYRKAIPCIDNLHREEFLSSGGGTSVFLQLIAVSSLVVFSSTSTDRAEPLYNPCVYLYTSIMSPLFRRYESEGRASFFSRLV